MELSTIENDCCLLVTYRVYTLNMSKILRAYSEMSTIVKRYTIATDMAVAKLSIGSEPISYCFRHFVDLLSIAELFIKSFGEHTYFIGRNMVMADRQAGGSMMMSRSVESKTLLSLSHTDHNIVVRQMHDGN